MTRVQQTGVRVFRSSEPAHGRPTFLALIGFVGLGLLVGLAGTAAGAPAAGGWYASLRQPLPLPPAAALAGAWVVVHMLAGLAAWRVWRRTGTGPSLRLWGWLLIASALWVPAFLGLRTPALGLVVLACLLPLTVLAIRAFRRVDVPAALLMLPHAACVLLVTVVNGGVVLMN